MPNDDDDSTADPGGHSSKAWVCGCMLAGIAGSIPDGGMDVCLECFVFQGFLSY